MTASDSSRSVFATAAVTVVAVAAALALAVFLSRSMPDTAPSWRSALPTPAMNAEQAQMALLRAELLHEEAVRPRLILAGFGSENDLGGSRYSSREAESANLTACLWTLRSFPQLYAKLLDGLLDAKLPPKERGERFYIMAGTLDALSGSFTDGRREYRGRRADSSYQDSSSLWFSYYNNAPDLKVSVPESDDIYYRERQRSGDEEPDADKKAALYKERLALANRLLPVVLGDMIREADAKIAREKEADSAANGTKKRRSYYGRDQIWEEYCLFSESAPQALKAIWEKRADPSFLPLALEAMGSKEGATAARYNAIPLMAQKPGLPLAEYTFWGKYKNDLRSVSSCIGTSPTSFAYLIGCCDKLGEITRDMLKKQGTLLLSGGEGPGITLTESSGIMPLPGEGGRLYLLADMSHALKDAPAYDLKRACPIFAGMLFRYLENQPLVLPLDPDNAGDAALIQWYANKGWALGHTLLFSAKGSPASVARHWGSLHLLWWTKNRKDKDTEPELAMLHPESGPFMLAILPFLKGPAAQRFMGPVSALWFGVADVDQTGWKNRMFTAKPEQAPVVQPLGAADKLPALMVTQPIAAELGNLHYRRYKIELAKWLEKKYPDPAVKPADIFSFADSTSDQLNTWKITRSRDMTRAAELLWRFRGDPDAAQILRSVLSQDTVYVHSRLEEARRALGLPKESER